MYNMFRWLCIPFVLLLVLIGAALEIISNACMVASNLLYELIEVITIWLDELQEPE